LNLIDYSSGAYKQLVGCRVALLSYLVHVCVQSNCSKQLTQGYNPCT
jgi:hypothetical protein